MTYFRTFEYKLLKNLNILGMVEIGTCALYAVSLGKLTYT